MSSLIVEVCKIKEILPHSGADLLEIAVVKGWEVIIKKDSYKTGDLVIYIPVDSILPVDMADKLGVRNYLKGKNKDRVGCAKLRGIMSYGLIVSNENNYEEGYDCLKELNIIKYEPPVRAMAGDAAPEDALFTRYTEIENIRNFPNIFEDGEMVVATEKIDGSNQRSQIAISPDGTIEWKAGSHKLKRKMPLEDEIENNIYWFPQTINSVKNLLNHLKNEVNFTATLYGEVYGRVRGGHKSLHYGKPGTLNFAAFSLKIDGKYVSWSYFEALCDRFHVPTVPVVDIFSFSVERAKELATGDSLLAAENGAKHMREGIVLCAFEERDEIDTRRAILKMLNPEYLILKNKSYAKGEATDFTDV